ncbi:FecR family protein [Mangrovimonas cancribranchiae]|uniref:FecR family protein n=1 Tax=Mangrovimonas cancribranchiae TaxID=3080055 RepID=A0AAU6P1H5_9FLAO
MEKDDLLKKWLNHELTQEEFQAFKQREDFAKLTQLSHGLKHFKAPELHTENALKSTLNHIDSIKPKRQWFKPLLRIAALLAIGFCVYYYTTTQDTTTKTLIAQKNNINLPDHSKVTLNALSTLTYNKHSWKDNREVFLQGEAFFKVAKGSKFNVITDLGTVTVLGTQFNVKQRDNFFEVTCYEGLVSVTYQSKNTKLPPGHTFIIRDGKQIATEKETAQVPQWLNNESTFKSIPLEYVIAEFERQYKVTFITDKVDTKTLFTGSFTHNNLDVAIKSITMPMHLSYSKTKDTIVLKRE